MASSFAIMPRSPCEASVGWTKNAGVPVEAKVAAIFWPICPLLPMPETITRPRARLRISTASWKGSAMPPLSAALSSASPSASASSVRSAEWTATLPNGVAVTSALSDLRAEAAILKFLAILLCIKKL